MQSHPMEKVFLVKPRFTCKTQRYYIYRLLVVLETAVNMSVTAVLYILIVGGFRNRGKHVRHRGIIYTGCWWFRKPR
jgi:hypothetical protein